MANLFSAEETAQGIPQAIFSLWFSDIEDFEVVKSHTRIVYRVHADGGCYYLKVIPDWEHKDVNNLDRTRYDRSTDFALHIANAGAPVARPISSKRGRTVEVQTFLDVPMVVQASSEVDGKEVSEECRDVDVFARCGIALAKFHVAAESFADASRFDGEAWETEWTEIGSVLPLDDPILQSEYRRIDAWLQGNRPLPGGKGLIHGDANVLNFIDDGKQVSLIDVDSPMLTWYATDLARPVRNLTPMTPGERADLWEGLMSGYRSIRSIDLDYECIRWILREWIIVDYVTYARMPNPEQKAYLKRWYSFVENPNQW